MTPRPRDASRQRQLRAEIARIRKMPVNDRIAWLEALDATDDPDLQVRMLCLLNDRDRCTRSSALGVPARAGGPIARVAAQAALLDFHWAVRGEAAAALGQMGFASDADRLEVVLENDPDWSVRSDAAHSLKIIANPHSRHALLRALRSERARIVRRDIAVALGALRRQDVAAVLDAALGSEQDEMARAGLLQALYMSGRRSALAHWLSLLGSQDGFVRCSVVNGVSESILPEDREQAMREVRSRLETETEPMVRECMEELLSSVTERQP